MGKPKLGVDLAGTLVPRHKDVSATVDYIPDNRTMIVTQLTADAPFLAEKPIDNAKTTTELLGIVKPNIDVEMLDENGMPINEKFRFNKVNEFGPEGLSKQSNFLTRLQRKQKNAETIKKRLVEVSPLKKLLGNADQKGLLIAQLQALLQELEEAEN